MKKKKLVGQLVFSKLARKKNGPKAKEHRELEVLIVSCLLVRMIDQA